jgi:hypothetical protein
MARKDAPDRVVYGVRGRPVQQKFGRTGDTWMVYINGVVYGLGRLDRLTSRRYSTKSRLVTFEKHAVQGR